MAVASDLLRPMKIQGNISTDVNQLEEPMEVLDTIKEQVEEHDILLYMKGSPDQPQCGFSAQASQALMACGEKLAFVDIL